jgi:hypothetical protein
VDICYPLFQMRQRDLSMSISTNNDSQTAPCNPTTLRDVLEPGEDWLLTRIVVDKAKAGDAGALRFVVGRLHPRPRGRAIVLDLPADMRQGNVVAVFDATLKAMAAGEITPEEARAVTLVLDGRLRVLEAWKRERRLERDDRFAPGGLLYPEKPVFRWHPDDEKEELPEPPGFAAAWQQYEAQRAEYEMKRGEIEARAAMPGGKRVEVPSRAGEGRSPANHLHPQAADGAATVDDETGASGDHLHSACIQPSPEQSHWAEPSIPSHGRT